MLTYKKLLFLLGQMTEEELKQPALFHSPYFGRTHEILAFAEVKDDPSKPVMALLGNNFN